MKTFLKLDRTEEAQKIARFTGEGAYHGSSNKEPEKLPVGEKEQFPLFRAFFKNTCEVKATLEVPSQKEIQEDGVTFVWAKFEEAKREAGPLTKKVLLEMEPHLRGDKKFVYVDSKIQFFHKGDLPVDSKLWHIDGTIAIRGDQARMYGYTLLHDLTAKLRFGIEDHYLAYQSSEHCATQWVVEGVEVPLPECIPSFDELDEMIRLADPITISQPAASIVHFTDNSLHRAVPASSNGWRLWIRVIETNKEVNLNSSIIECYNTVYKQ